MKKIQKVLFVITIFFNFAPFLYSKEFENDSTKSIYRVQDHMMKGWYPDLNLLKSRLHEYHRSDGKPGENDDVWEVEEIQDMDPNYWTDRIMNFEELRAQFPIFKTLVQNRPVVYLDSASTSQMPQSVIDAIVEYYETYRANVGRGLYAFAEKSTKMFELSRAKIAKFINAEKYEIIFTSGTTASINLAGHIWVQHHIAQGDEIVISEVEHNSNFLPWQQLALRKGAILKRVPLNNHGVVELDTFKKYLSSKTKFVALTHQSNILGIVNDLKPLIAAAHEVGAKVLIDGAQSVVHTKIDVKDLDCDFFAFSGHKLFGPTGVGVLFMKYSMYDQTHLSNFGGGMVYSITPDHSEFKCMPYCFEPGTQAIAQVIGLGAVVDFIKKNVDFAQVQAYETKLITKLAAALLELPGITLLSPIPQEGQHSSLLTFISDRYNGYDIAEFLNKYGIAVRAGYHCVQLYHDEVVQGAASVRVSLSFYNTQEEIDYLIEVLKKLFV